MLKKIFALLLLTLSFQAFSSSSNELLAISSQGKTFFKRQEATTTSRTILNELRRLISVNLKKPEADKKKALAQFKKDFKKGEKDIFDVLILKWGRSWAYKKMQAPATSWGSEASSWRRGPSTPHTHQAVKPKPLVVVSTSAATQKSQKQEEPKQTDAW